MELLLKCSFKKRLRRWEFAFQRIRKFLSTMITSKSSDFQFSFVLLLIFICSSYWKKNRWDLIKPNNTVFVHQLDGEIYAQLINLSSAYEVYFHGAMEVPDISKQRYSFGAHDYTTVELLGLEILTSDNARE